MKFNDFKSKEDLQEVLLKILDPLKKYYSPGCARVNLGNTKTHYSDASIELEGFSRVLWGLVPFYAGGGKHEEFKRIYTNGFKAGSDPNHDEYWGESGNSSQNLVEMAAIALGIIMTPELYWDELNNEEKINLVRWLYRINEVEIPNNNWLFFRILVNIALKKRGQQYSFKQIEDDFEAVEKFYLGEGWYCDGSPVRKDYYISFGIHFYSLLYAKFMYEEDKERCEKLINRAEEFAKTFIYWFADDGKALPYGRSLTYRFSQVSFWSAYAFCGCKGFSKGVVKGLIMRHLRDWFSQPIFDNDNVLTIGYSYPNLNMSEIYNSPGSPYWALKTFLILSIDDKEFWECDEEPMQKLDEIKLIKQANMLIQRTKNAGVFAFVGNDVDHTSTVHASEKYQKFAYSTHFGFSVPRSYRLITEAATDSMLTFVKDNMCFVRDSLELLELNQTKIVTAWKPFEGIQVITTIRPQNDGYFIENKIHSEVSCEAYLCGYAQPRGNNNYKCTIESLDNQGVNSNIYPITNTNLLHQRTLIPSLKFNIEKGDKTIQAFVKADISIS